MNKWIAMLVVLVCGWQASALYQYDVNAVANPNQTWTSAQYLTLTAPESGSMWFASFISSYYGGVLDLGNEANVTAGNYGWIDADGNKISGTGATTEFTFTNSVGKSVTTIGYYVGNFSKGDTINFWITSLNNELGLSDGNVMEGDNINLISRQNNLTDLAGNTRINFGYDSGSVEFIALGENMSPAGQPLPGVIASLLAGAAVVGGLRRRRKQQS